MNEKKLRRYQRGALALMGRAWQLDQGGQKLRAYGIAEKAYKLLEQGLRNSTAEDIRPIHIATFKLAANIAALLNDSNRVLELIDDWLNSHLQSKVTDELKALARNIMAASLERAAQQKGNEAA